MKLEQTEIKEPLDTSRTIAEKLPEGREYPWGVLGDTSRFIESLGASLPESEYKKIGEDIWIHRTTQVAPTTIMGRPMIIGSKVQIRNGASLRGSVILGQYVVIGNSCEIKNSIIFDKAQVPHFNYIGDSIPGYKAHIGAGAMTSNVKADKGFVKVHAEDGGVETGRKEFGTILGDHAKIGYNSVPNPGTVIGRNSNVCPLSNVRGYVPSNSIYEGQDNIVAKEIREVEVEWEAPETPEKGKDGLRIAK